MEFPELKIIITEMKNLLKGLKRKFQHAKELANLKIGQLRLYSLREEKKELRK